MKHVVFATNNNRDYCFFAPITAKLWKFLGHQPHVFVVDDVWEGSEKIALDELKKAAEVYPLKIPEGYRSSTVTQVSRLLGITLPVADSDIVMTADVDMLPLNAAFFDQQGPNISIFYSNAYDHEDRPHYPICYISAPKSTWGEITGVNSDRDALVKDILYSLPTTATKSAAWNYDEFWISLQLVKHPDYPNAKLIPRDKFGGMVIRRIDRARAFNPPPWEADDAHCWRPGYDPVYWPRVLSIIAHVCPDMVPWAEKYWRDFMRELPKVEPLPVPVEPPEEKVAAAEKPKMKATPFPSTRFVPQSLYRRIG